MFQANGTAERDAALVMLEEIPGVGRGGRWARTRATIPKTSCGRVPEHVSDTARGAERQAEGRQCLIDGRTTHTGGYAVSQRKRKRIEECFGWLKTIALMRKVRHRSLAKVGWVFTFAAAAYNLVRMRNLLASRGPLIRTALTVNSWPDSESLG